MKIKNNVILLVVLSQLMCIVGFAQQMKVIQGKPGEIFMIPEVGAVIQLKDKKILVENVMPQEARDKDYKNVDLKEKDEILMVNGKKIKTVKELQDIYERLKTGEELKLGVSREDKMFIVGFKRADVSKIKSGGKMIVKKDGKEGDIKVIPEFGIVLSGSEGKVTIKDVIKELPDSKGKDVKEGDLLIKVNGVSVKSIKDVDVEYTKIQTGKKIELVLLRNKKETTITTEKKAGDGKIIIKK